MYFLGCIMSTILLSTNIYDIDNKPHGRQRGGCVIEISFGLQPVELGGTKVRNVDTEGCDVQDHLKKIKCQPPDPQTVSV